MNVPFFSCLFCAKPVRGATRQTTVATPANAKTNCFITTPSLTSKQAADLALELLLLRHAVVLEADPAVARYHERSRKRQGPKRRFQVLMSVPDQNRVI